MREKREIEKGVPHVHWGTFSDAICSTCSITPGLQICKRFLIAKSVLTVKKRRYILHKNQGGGINSRIRKGERKVKAQTIMQNGQFFGFTFFGGFYFSRFFPVSEKMPVNGNLSR